MEPDQLLPGEKKSTSTDEAADFEPLVRRSDEDVAAFDSSRITDALVREAHIDSVLAEQISLDIRQVIQRLGLRTLSSSLIRGLVDSKLLELGLEDAHRLHTRLGVPYFDVDRLMHSSFRDSLSQPCGPDGTSLMLAEAIKREYAILGVFSEPVADAHLVGDIHIDAVGAVDRPHSLISAIDYVKRFGISLPPGFASARPARHGEVLIAHIVKLSAALQGYLAGPIAWDSVNFALAPLLEDAGNRTIKQYAQTLLFELSAPAVARGGQIILSELHLDWDPPAYLASRAALGAGGRETGRLYADYVSEARQFLHAMLEVFLEGDGSGRSFLMPRPVLHINRRFNESPGHREFLEVVSRLALERGGLTIMFDRDEERAFFRRFGIDDSAGIGRTGTDALRSALFQVVYLNLPRVGHLAAGNQVRVFEELTRLMEMAAAAHLEKRVFLEKLLALGERGPLAALATRDGGVPFLKLDWTTHAICFVGLNELCRSVFQSDLAESEAAREFALKVMSHLRREAIRLSHKHNVRFVLGGHSSEVAAYRLARLDTRFFGETAAGAACGNADADTAYYTDSTRLRAGTDIGVLDQLHIEGLLHDFGVLGAASEVWIGESRPTEEDLGGLILRALYHSSCSGLVLCPEFTACSSCGRTSRGSHSQCGRCGSDRVEGLAYGAGRYGSTSGWDRGRLAELRDRRRVNTLGS